MRYSASWIGETKCGGWRESVAVVEEGDESHPEIIGRGDEEDGIGKIWS